MNKDCVNVVFVCAHKNLDFFKFICQVLPFTFLNCREVTVTGDSVLYQQRQCKLIFGPQVLLPR